LICSRSYWRTIQGDIGVSYGTLFLRLLTKETGKGSKAATSFCVGWIQANGSRADTVVPFMGALST
jgi:hypothetical protein